MDLETLAFNRDPAFIGDPASIRTLASSLLRLLMSSVPMFPVYVNFYSSCVNCQRVAATLLLVSLPCLAKKNNELSVSALSARGSYDVTSVWLVLLTTLYF